MLDATVNRIRDKGVGFNGWKYDPTALIGLLVLVLPTIINEMLESGDLELVPWVKWPVYIIGALLAAYGRSVVVRDGA